MKAITIFGAKSFTQYAPFCNAMSSVIQLTKMPEFVITGDTVGVDNMTQQWCSENHINFKINKSFINTSTKINKKIQHKSYIDFDEINAILNQTNIVVAFLSEDSIWLRLFLEQAKLKSIESFVFALSSVKCSESNYCKTNNLITQHC